MEPLEFPDQHYVRAADGWMDLGDATEAARELTRVSRAGQRQPDTLEVQWRVYAQREEWQGALRVAMAVVSVAPERASGWIHRSYSLHELKRTPEAMETLLPAAERFPTDPIIPYNLACYACQLGNVPQAKVWLRKAADLRGRDAIRKLARDDTDLAPLLDFLGSL